MFEVFEARNSHTGTPWDLLEEQRQHDGGVSALSLVWVPLRVTLGGRILMRVGEGGHAAHTPPYECRTGEAMHFHAALGVGCPWKWGWGLVHSLAPIP